MKPSLQVRLSQHLALTPQLQQSIRLLQLSTLELQQEVEQMLEQNPFLETDEEAVPAFEQSLERPSASATAAAERDDAEASGGAAGDEPAGVDAAEFGTPERDDWENGTERDDFDGIRELPSNSGSAAVADDDFDPQERNVAAPTLQDHLRAQLAGMRLGAEDLLELGGGVDRAVPVDQQHEG